MPKRLSGRERLAQHMEDRRLDLELDWADVARIAKVSTETLRQARFGDGGIRAKTKRGIERALEWKPGSVNKILAGGDPEDDIKISYEIPPQPKPDERREELHSLIDRVPEADLARVHGYLTGVVEPH